MLDNWPEKFPNCEPIGYRLREAFHDRWVRFHSLPESKHYPENESEYEILLHRHNTVLAELLGTERSVVLLTTGDSESPEPTRSDAELGSHDPVARHWRTVAMHSVVQEFSNPSYWHVFAAMREWQPGLFDPLIRLVANYVLANVMFVHPDCRWLLHPYDGGIDVIAESPAHRGRLREAHKDWLSSRTDGL